MTPPPDADTEWDLLVLGGGSAGSAAAAEAVKQGHARVAMVNDGELGGLCILRGCMPTKTLIHTSDLLLEAREGPTIGVELGPPRLDMVTLQDRRRRLVERFQRAKISGIESGGYEVVDGRARFVDERTVEVTHNPGGETSRHAARTFMVATGSRQRVPPIPGFADVPFWTSDEALTAHEVPESLTVIGAGAIGIEFSTYFAALGTRVTMVNRSPVLNKGEDHELSACAVRALEHCGVEVIAPCEIYAVERDGELFVTSVRHANIVRSVVSRRLLNATGRVPALEDLGLDRAGIEVQGDHPVLDAALRTTNARVFCAGDAAGDRLLLHTGNAQGRHVARQLSALSAGREPEPFADRVPLAVVFGHPPYAEAGLRRVQAERRGLEVEAARKDWANQGRGIVMNTTPGAGFLELVARRTDGVLVGTQILGPRADELVHVVAALLWHGTTVHEVLHMPWYHPTLCEGILELARELSGRCGRRETGADRSTMS